MRLEFLLFTRLKVSSHHKNSSGIRSYISSSLRFLPRRPISSDFTVASFTDTHIPKPFPECSADPCTYHLHFGSLSAFTTANLFNGYLFINAGIISIN